MGKGYPPLTMVGFESRTRARVRRAWKKEGSLGARSGEEEDEGKNRQWSLEWASPSGAPHMHRAPSLSFLFSVRFVDTNRSPIVRKLLLLGAPLLVVKSWTTLFPFDERQSSFHLYPNVFYSCKYIKECRREEPFGDCFHIFIRRSCFLLPATHEIHQGTRTTRKINVDIVLLRRLCFF